ncbi:hypothetical protein UFOVP274_34 [uncultured Caudovirales phage]|uniref:Uncharacterized protein n=1 Tax=uncultured Caudovirales phage TaxID=2100421 RepID=A0A6J5LJB6_9CAUD|nr:hypothetical protein UFOVP274_34 [uncultured Caudovirales phage]
MPTTYTSSLGLSLPATGDNSGTWGDLVNNGITTLLDTAIAGKTTITMANATYTLSTTQGAANESRAMFIVCAGTNSAPQNVVCPTVTKLYFVQNSTGQTITFKTAAGTGIAVSNGTTVMLWCDGTNVVNAFNQFNGTTTTATNLASGSAGTIPYQTGAGATGFSAAGTSGQVLLSGGTGSPTWADLTQNTTAPSRVRYLTAGTTYTVPTGVVRIRVFVFGATGASASVSSVATGGVGGAGYSEKYYAPPLAASYSYTIGAAGVTGTNTGTAGGTTSFGVMSVPGSSGTTTTAGSSGAAGTGGDFNATGGNGSSSPAGISSAGGGGGAGSRAGNGGNGGAGVSGNANGGGGGGGTGGNAGGNGSGSTGGAGGAAATTLSGSAITLTGWDTIGTYTFQGGTAGATAGSGIGGAGASGTEIATALLGGASGWMTVSNSAPGGGYSVGQPGSAGQIIVWEYTQ